MTAHARSIGALALLALGINGIVGVGIFFAPSELAQAAGRAGSVGVVLGVAAALLPVAVTFAILGRRFDVDGGPVAFARAAFGEQTAFGIGWVVYASAVFSTSAVMRGLAEALAGEQRATPVSLAIALSLAALAVLGVRVSKRAWSGITIVKLVPLLALAGAAAVAGAAPPSDAVAETAVSADLRRAALTACFAYQGFEIVSVIAGQTKAPERAVPFATYGSLGFAAVLYAILQWAFVSRVDDLAADAPLVATAATLGGERFAAIVHAGTSVSALGIAFGMIVTTPRYLTAAVPGGSVGRVNERGVPKAALGVTLGALVVLLSMSNLRSLFALSSLAVVLQYAAVALSLLKLTRDRALGLRPLHAIPALLTLATAAVLLTAATAEEWITLGVVAIAGAGAHFAIQRKG